VRLIVSVQVQSGGKAIVRAGQFKTWCFIVSALVGMAVLIALNTLPGVQTYSLSVKDGTLTYASVQAAAGNALTFPTCTCSQPKVIQSAYTSLQLFTDEYWFVFCDSGKAGRLCAYLY
jgi:hypothetical protein